MSGRHTASRGFRRPPPRACRLCSGVGSISWPSEGHDTARLCPMCWPPSARRLSTGEIPLMAGQR